MGDGFDKDQVAVGEVEVRVAHPHERRHWDALMDRYHSLGFRQFAGRGLRHVAVWRGQWLWSCADACQTGRTTCCGTERRLPTWISGSA